MDQNIYELEMLEKRKGQLKRKHEVDMMLMDERIAILKNRIHNDNLRVTTTDVQRDERFKKGPGVIIVDEKTLRPKVVSYQSSKV